MDYPEPTKNTGAIQPMVNILHSKKASRLGFEEIHIPVLYAFGTRLALGIIAFFAYILYPQSPERSFPNPNPEISDLSVVYDRVLAVWVTGTAAGTSGSLNTAIRRIQNHRLFCFFIHC
jgi:hypothetical protein